LKYDLILICNSFPFGHGETFLANEASYLYKHFRKVLIITRSDSQEQTREIPETVTNLKLSPKSSGKEKLRLLLLSIRKGYLVLSMISGEIKTIRKTYKRSIDRKLFGRLWHDTLKALEISEYLKRNALPLVSENSVLYSYWQDSSAIAIAILKKENPGFKCISRAHRGDLYFFAQHGAFLPYRKFLSEKLDRLFFISEDGMKYQSELLGIKYSSYDVSRLGTLRIQGSQRRSKSEQTVIVSCSNITPVKRVDLIIRTLACINDHQMKWLHIGSGRLEKEIFSAAEMLLSSKENIDYSFLGRWENNRIHDFYANNQIDVFINVSESEGIPVSIMEAMSYSIPVIATDVGGTSEIVNNHCGLLVEKDIEAQALAENISFEITTNALQEKSENAFNTWKSKFSAEENYMDFINKIYLI